MHDRLPNLLGAAALAVVDLSSEALDEAGGGHPSASAALLRIARQPGIGTTELAQRIKLTQPAASRLVDGLAARGLVERESRSGRSVALRLTAAGRSVARRLLTARHEAIDALLARLDAGERAALERSLEKILDRAIDEVGSEFVVCRLCDVATCFGGGATCSVHHASQQRGDHR